MITGIGLGGMVLAVFRLPTVDHWTTGGGATFLIGPLVIAVQSVYPGRFSSPKCGCRIHKAIRFVGPLQYHCQLCDVIWDTGVKRWTGGD